LILELICFIITLSFYLFIASGKNAKNVCPFISTLGIHIRQKFGLAMEAILFIACAHWDWHQAEDAAIIGPSNGEECVHMFGQWRAKQLPGVHTNSAENCLGVKKNKFILYLM
jgi:hypothetical protein